MAKVTVSPEEALGIKKNKMRAEKRARYEDKERGISVLGDHKFSIKSKRSIIR